MFHCNVSHKHIHFSEPICISQTLKGGGGRRFWPGTGKCSVPLPAPATLLLKISWVWPSSQLKSTRDMRVITQDQLWLTHSGIGPDLLGLGLIRKNIVSLDVERKIYTTWMNFNILLFTMLIHNSSHFKTLYIVRKGPTILQNQMISYQKALWWQWTGKTSF